MMKVNVDGGSMHADSQKWQTTAGWRNITLTFFA